MSRVLPDCDNGEEADLCHEDRMAGQISQKLNAHPDCRDPDHPGCTQCEEIDECDECGQPLDDCYCEGYQDIEESQDDSTDD